MSLLLHLAKKGKRSPFPGQLLLFAPFVLVEPQRFIISFAITHREHSSLYYISPIHSLHSEAGGTTSTIYNDLWRNVEAIHCSQHHNTPPLPTPTHTKGESGERWGKNMNFFELSESNAVLAGSHSRHGNFRPFSTGMYFLIYSARHLSILYSFRNSCKD